MKIRTGILSLASILSIGCVAPIAPKPAWSQQIDQELHQLGYQNWVVIADASFPVSSRPGVKTIFIEEEVPLVLESVLYSLEERSHCIPRVILSEETKAITNEMAPGIEEWKRLVKYELHGREPRYMMHRTLMLLLEGSQANYSMLVIKTQTALPYSSVFIELDSGYWDHQAEGELRRRMK